MGRSRWVNPEFHEHEGDARRSGTGKYTPLYTHQEIDAILQNAAYRLDYLLDLGDLDRFYVPLGVTLGPVTPGSEISGSVPWASRALCNLVRVEMDVATEMEFMLLRQPVFDSTNRSKHAAFSATGVGNKFMREGGALFDYFDENQGENLHYWFKNVGLSASSPTLILNTRTPQ